MTANTPIQLLGRGILSRFFCAIAIVAFFILCLRLNSAPYATHTEAGETLLAFVEGNAMPYLTDESFSKVFSFARYSISIARPHIVIKTTSLKKVLIILYGYHPFFLLPPINAP